MSHQALHQQQGRVPWSPKPATAPASRARGHTATAPTPQGLVQGAKPWCRWGPVGTKDRLTPHPGIGAHLGCRMVHCGLHQWPLKINIQRCPGPQLLCALLPTPSHPVPRGRHNASRGGRPYTEAEPVPNYWGGGGAESWPLLMAGGHSLTTTPLIPQASDAWEECPAQHLRAAFPGVSHLHLPCPALAQTPAVPREAVGSWPGDQSPAPVPVPVSHDR